MFSAPFIDTEAEVGLNVDGSAGQLLSAAFDALQSIRTLTLSLSMH